MRFTIRIAIAALSISSIAPAFADSEGGTDANVFLRAQAPAQHGQAVQAFATHSKPGVWLSQPQDGGGANS